MANTVYMRRPGKEGGVSASLFPDTGVFYNFTSNGFPFESDKAYSPFGVYTLLEHGGDFAAAAKALADEGYGDTPHTPAPPRPRTTRGKGDADGTAATDGDRPHVQTNNRQLRDIVTDITAAIVAHNDPPRLFLRSGRLVEVRNDGQGFLSIVDMDSYSLRNVANSSADFVSVSGEGDDVKVRHTKPPMDAMTSILAHPESVVGLPPLGGVVMSPVLSAGGVLETGQGYLRSAQLYCQPPEGQLALALPEPTREAVDQALGDLFGFLLDGFPFVDDASRAHTLAAILLPFLRPYIQGPTPLHLINASTPATGKSLLAEVIGTFSAPGNIVPTPAPSSEDEWRKKITAALRGGPPFFWIDNLEGKVQSESLCVALTGTQWSDRQLGASTELRLPIFCTWLATANNARLHKDVVSRSVLIYLDAGMEHPEERRDFKVKNPVAEVRQNRARWLDAVFVLIRHWLDQGAPTTTGKGTSRFPAWSSTLGGLLECLGVPGFLGNVTELAQGADPEHEAWRAFVEAWGHRYGTQPVKASHELYDLAFGAADYDGKPTTEGILTEYLDAENRPKRTARLGIALKSRRGRVYGAWKLMSQPGKTTTHFLERVAATTDSAAGVAGVSPPASQAPEPPAWEELDLEAKQQRLLDEWVVPPELPQPPQEGQESAKKPLPTGDGWTNSDGTSPGEIRQGRVTLWLAPLPGGTSLYLLCCIHCLGCSRASGGRRSGGPEAGKSTCRSAPRGDSPRCPTGVAPFLTAPPR